MSEVYQSLAHSKWNCKYHLVFIPKYRRKAIYGELRTFLGPVFLPCPWIPTVGAEVEALYFGEWVSATVLSCPSNETDPRRRISG